MTITGQFDTSFDSQHPAQHLTRRRWLITGTLACAAVVSTGCRIGSPSSDSGSSSGGGGASAAYVSCEKLNGMTIESSLIGEPTTGAVVSSVTYFPATVAVLNTAGTATEPAMPDYCQVLVTINPVDPTAPAINSEINLPTPWNGKMLQFGGGGFDGSLVTGLTGIVDAGPDITLPITQGFITVGTDSGHSDTGGGEEESFALNQESLLNFAYESYKKTKDVAVQIGLSYYGQMPSHSYFAGGSEGGREAMSMAQLYPDDFDGIIAVDPVMNWTALQLFGNFVGGTLQSATNAWLGNSLTLIMDTVTKTCDALDGIVDTVATNYQGCDAAMPQAIANLACPSGTVTGPNCLSSLQLAALQAAHTGLTFDFPLANGITSYAGFGWGGEGLPGVWTRFDGTVEPNWTGPPTSPNDSLLYAYGNGVIRYFIVQNADFDPLSFDADAYQTQIQAVSAEMDATNPDLSAFFSNGGKLILKEDLSDTAEAAITGENYYNSVVAALGQQTTSQSFMVYALPGLPHVSDGFPAGTPNAPTWGIPGYVDLLSLLDNWVTTGTAPPSQVNAYVTGAIAPYTQTATKPMCSYPMYASYTGGTDTAGGDLASNYVCTTN